MCVCWELQMLNSSVAALVQSNRRDCSHLFAGATSMLLCFAWCVQATQGQPFCLESRVQMCLVGLSKEPPKLSVRKRPKQAPGAPRISARTPQDAPRRSQDGRKMPQEEAITHCKIQCFLPFQRQVNSRRPKNNERCPKQPQDGPKMAPRWPKMAPRLPKRAQDGPKKAPRWHQDGSTTAPGRPQDGPKMAWDGLSQPRDRLQHALLLQTLVLLLQMLLLLLQALQSST